MFELLKIVLPRLTGPVAWGLAGFLAVFTLFVGLTLGVALFSPDRARREQAIRILRELLAFLRFLLTAGIRR